MHRTVLIDPGHGGPGTGCSANGIDEGQFVFDFAAQLEARLSASCAPITAGLSRSATECPSFRERNDRAGNCDLVLCVHVNAFGSDSARGAMAFASGLSGLAMSAGDAMLRAWPSVLAPASPVTQILSRTNESYESYPRAANVIYAYTPPVLLLEMFFATSPNDAHAVRNRAVFEQMILACQLGLLELFV